MYNIEDFKNAIRILQETQQYVKTKMVPYVNDDAFVPGKVLMNLGESKYPEARNGSSMYLVLDGSQMSIKYKCNDNYEFYKQICSNADSSGEKLHFYKSRYAYNDTEQKTIDLAVAISCRWPLIKDEIDKIIKSFIDEQSRRNVLLKTFNI